jgi:hypothetical protein
MTNGLGQTANANIRPTNANVQMTNAGTGTVNAVVMNRPILCHHFAFNLPILLDESLWPLTRLQAGQVIVMIQTIV